MSSCRFEIGTVWEDMALMILLSMVGEFNYELIYAGDVSLIVNRLITNILLPIRGLGSA